MNTKYKNYNAIVKNYIKYKKLFGDLWMKNIILHGSIDKLQRLHELHKLQRLR